MVRSGGASQCTETGINSETLRQGTHIRHDAKDISVPAHGEGSLFLVKQLSNMCA